MIEFLLDYNVLIIALIVLVYNVHKELYNLGIISPLFRKKLDFDDSFYLKQIQTKYLKGNGEYVGKMKLGREISFISQDKHGNLERVFKN